MYASLTALLILGAGLETETVAERAMVVPLSAPDVERNVRSLFDSSVLDALTRQPRVEAVSEADVQRILDAEAQRQLADCADTSCFNDLAAALGARFALHGTATKVSGTYVVQLNWLDVLAGRALGRRTVKGEAALEVAAALEAAVLELTGGAPDVAEPAPRARPALWPAATVAGAGLALVAVGAVWALAVEGSYLEEGANLEARKSAQAQGQVALVVVGVGALTALAGGAWGTYGLLSE